MIATAPETVTAIENNRSWLEPWLMKYIEKALDDVIIEDSENEVERSNRWFSRIEDFGDLLSLSFMPPTPSDPEGYSWVVSYEARMHGAFGGFCWPDEDNPEAYTTTTLPPRNQWIWGISGYHDYLIKGEVIFNWRQVKSPFYELNNSKYIMLGDIFVNDCIYLEETEEE